MKTKYLLIISLFVILMSMTGISASENVNQTDSLGLSVENNFETEEDEREIIRQKPDEVELKENENGSIYSNILAVSNEDEILGKDIYVTRAGLGSSRSRTGTQRLYEDGCPIFEDEVSLEFNLKKSDKGFRYGDTYYEIIG